MEIRDCAALPSEEALPLYESAGWTNYTGAPEMLEAALRGSLRVLGAYDGALLTGLIRTVGDGSSILFVQDILVLPAYRRRGIGSALMRALLASFPGVYQVRLCADDTEEAARFYRSLGFLPDEETGCRSFSILR